MLPQRAHHRKKVIPAQRSTRTFTVWEGLRERGVRGRVRRWDWPAMEFTDFARRLLAIAETIYRWAGMLSHLDETRRERIALFAEEIAATLSRAAQAFARLDHQPNDKQQLLCAARELGRIAGYLDTIVLTLAHHLDGRKLAGVKRRLEHLQPYEPAILIKERGAFENASRLTSAEGFFRALADALRASTRAGAVKTSD